MPIYLYKCPGCNKSEEVVKRIAELDRREFCTLCNSSMQRVICAPAVRGDYEGYVSPATGKWIEGRAAHLEDLKRSGCRIREPGETEEFMRNYKKQADEQLDFKVSEAMNQALIPMGIEADAHQIDVSGIADSGVTIERK